MTTEARHPIGLLLLVAGIVIFAVAMSGSRGEPRATLACAQATPGSVVTLFACGRPPAERSREPAPPAVASQRQRSDVSTR